MAQQTINVGTAPNDGTGTPLRTAFQYTNSNFSELYTAVGPSGNNIVVPGNATITGDLTVDTNTLKVDSANNRVGIGTASPGLALDIVGSARVTYGQSYNSFTSGGSNSPMLSCQIWNAVGNIVVLQNPYSDVVIGSSTTGTSTERYRIASDGVATWSNVGGVAGTAMTLNSTGLGVGLNPSSYVGRLVVGGTPAATSGALVYVRDTFANGSNNSLGSIMFASSPGTDFYVGKKVSSAVSWFSIGNANSGAEYFQIDSSGNVGIGVTPSAWTASYNALNIGSGGSIAAYKSANYDQFYVGSNFFENTSGAWRFINNGYATQYWHNSGSHVWRISTTSNAAGANQPLSWNSAMTLDASGNLLVGTTSGSNSRFVKAVAAGTTVLEVTGAAGYGSYFNSGDAQGSSSALSIANIGRVVSTGRSINAGGTINASGADYAEYMTKASDFVLSKGDVAGIDANGKLTNVFADAVSFVVKSTDPSYVGNDKWGIDIEGDALEAARQLVDRIAFAGQVPVNVTGAKAGDYIVPVVDGTGIKGIAVSNPTFEQYQLAVGKVIAIDADGRARIIVKVA